MGLAAVAAMRDIGISGGTIADANGALASVYLHFGIESWSFIEFDERKDPVPVPINAATIDRLLPYGDGGLEVAEACERLYGEEIARPLAKRMQTSSETTPTPKPTSPTIDTGQPLPEPSEPSSPSDSDGTPSEDPAP
ncbi:MAG: hypothetical protein PHS14_13145 [Elusimicrobia bacterium]|nr:hypothetical protein [Elusimicrobiota bacterium]